jgi:hypothetical protein
LDAVVLVGLDGELVGVSDDVQCRLDLLVCRDASIGKRPGEVFPGRVLEEKLGGDIGETPPPLDGEKAWPRSAWKAINIARSDRSASLGAKCPERRRLSAAAALSSTFWRMEVSIRCEGEPSSSITVWNPTPTAASLTEMTFVSPVARR